MKINGEAVKKKLNSNDPLGQVKCSRHSTKLGLYNVFFDSIIKCSLYLYSYGILIMLIAF